LSKLVDFKKRINWFESYRHEEQALLANEEHSDGGTDTPSLVPQKRLVHLAGAAIE